jgi:hypothetical protein
MRFCQARFSKGTAAILAVLAWFVGTQHCLLSSWMNNHLQTAIPACHCQEPAKGPAAPTDGPASMLSCCQGLVSPNLELGQAKLSFSPVLLGLQLVASDQHLRLEALQPPRLSTEYDHGPPRASWFIGTVLKRSLTENAPPFIA